VIFLDEIGEMPLPLQVKLLRALQERRIRRLGANEERPIDVRVIGATNQDLRGRSEQGAFRQDLFFRLNILHIELPPLRERLEDLPVLAEHFLNRFTRKLNKGPMSLGAEALEAMRHYRFNGNVRELENLMERCVALNAGGPIGLDLFPGHILGEATGPDPVPTFGSPDLPTEGFDLEAYLVAYKAYLLRKAAEHCGGNRTKAAQYLGMSFRAYRYWLHELGGLEALPAACPAPHDFPTSSTVDGEVDL